MSINIIKHINVDLYGDVVRFAVSAKQNDMSSRYVGVTLLENGAEFEIPDDVEIVAAVKKNDKRIVWNDCTRSGNEVLIQLTSQMLAAQGIALCDVELHQSGVLLTSATFEIMVFPSQRVDSTIISSGEYTRLENAIYAAREALAIAQDIENEAGISEPIRVAAEAVRVAQENARVAAEKLREQQKADTIQKTAECVSATEKTKQLHLELTDLDGILKSVKDYYGRLQELESDINVNIDGGTPFTTDYLLIDGGTPFTTDYDKYNTGTPFTI